MTEGLRRSGVAHLHALLATAYKTAARARFFRGRARRERRPPGGYAECCSMFGRFMSSQRREAVGERFGVGVPAEYGERFNLAPQQRALIVREGEREAALVVAA